MTVFLQRRWRNRWAYLSAIVLTIVAGLASRHFPDLLPSAFGKYPGDVLWALMVFFGWGFVFRKASSLCVVSLAFGTSCVIEVLKLWQSSWWDGIRHTIAGHLIFGQAFSAWNLVAYAAGVMCGVVIEMILTPKRSEAFLS